MVMRKNQRQKKLKAGSNASIHDDDDRADGMCSHGGYSTS
jgi:hypothetical protein